MNCKQVHGKLQPLVDGALRPSQVLEITEHLKGCVSCRQEFHALQDLEAALSLEPIINPPPGMASHIAGNAFKRYLLTRRLLVPRWLEALTFGGLSIALVAAAAMVSAVAQTSAAISPAASAIGAASIFLLCLGFAAFGSFYYGA